MQWVHLNETVLRWGASFGRTYSPSLVRFPVLELLLMGVMELILLGSEGDVLPVSPMLLTRLVSFFFSLRPKLIAKDSAPLCKRRKHVK